MKCNTLYKIVKIARKCSQFQPKLTFNLVKAIVFKSFHREEKWLPGQITCYLGDVMFKIKLEGSNPIVRKHLNQICNSNPHLDFDMEISNSNAKNEMFLTLLLILLYRAYLHQYLSVIKGGFTI